MNLDIDTKLNDLINSDDVQKILNLVNKKRNQGINIYPQQNQIFKAFELSKLSDTKVVIFGQDPYYKAGVADGLCFSTKQNQTPASLLNIFKELKNEYKEININSNDLSPWAHQGVLLLNTILTVEENKPLSHKNLGWNKFIKEIIKLINSYKKDVIFVLWGNNSKSLEKLIDTSKHYVLKSAHPSPFSFLKGFWGNNHFKEINKILKQTNQKEIDWNLY